MQLVKDFWRLPLFCLAGKTQKSEGGPETLGQNAAQSSNRKEKNQNTLDTHQLQVEDVVITKEILDKEAHLQQNFHKACLAKE